MDNLNNPAFIRNLVKNRYVDEFHLGEPKFPEISICTPLYESSVDWMLTQYIYAIRKLNYPKHLISLYFTVQGYDDTYDIMCNWLDIVGDEYSHIKIEEVPMIKSDEIPHVQNVVKCRNLLKKWSKPDMVLFVDCDNFPPPHSLRRLIDGVEFGADIVGSPYIFHKLDQKNPHEVGNIGLTSFFKHSDGLTYHPVFNRTKGYGRMWSGLFTKRVWCDAISMGNTIVTRRVLDDVDFYVPFKTRMTDDTAFCQEAREKGYKIITDFTFITPHWGFHHEWFKDEGDYSCFNIGITKDFNRRRERMKRDKSVIKYVKYY